MIKKVIKFTDYDDNECEETHYFNLSKPELLRLEASYAGGISKHLSRLSVDADGAEIMRVFEDIIGRSYGERVDGSASKFFKSPDKTKEFLESLAYDALFMELISSPAAAADFVNRLIPADLQKLVEKNSVLEEAKAAAGLSETSATEPEDERPLWEQRELTSSELNKLSKTDLVKAMMYKNQPRQIL